MNPFINPNQRGVGLPPGFKDLMDVIKSLPVVEGPMSRAQLARPATKSLVQQVSPQIEFGQMKDIEAKVAKFLEFCALKHRNHSVEEPSSPSPQPSPPGEGEASAASPGMFSVTNPARRIFLTVMCHDEKLSLNIFVYRTQPAVKEALRRVLRDDKLCRSERDAEHVNVPLANSAKEVANVLKKLLVEGFGLGEEEPLLFHAHSKPG